jgi:Icc-related predicted phosphoesterase
MSYFRDVIDAAKDQKVVVVGHHAPTYQSIHPKYVKEREMNGGYASDLSEFILDRPQIRLWTHGHVHNFSDYMVGDTRVFCNPRGYVGYGEETEWDPMTVIEL